MQEIYSLLKSLQLVIVGCQSTRSITSVPTMSGLVMLLTRDLNVNRPLLLHNASPHHPVPCPPSKVVGNPSLLPPPPPPPADPQDRTERTHADLTPTGKSTRVQTREAVWKHFGSKRYGSEFKEESHLFDMAMALNPGCRALGYVDVLSPTPDLAKAIKAAVWAQLASRVGEVVASERAANRAAAIAAATLNSADQGVGQAHKRPRLGKQTVDAAAQRVAQRLEMQQSGLYDDALDSSSDSGEETEEEGGQSIAAEAYMLINEWRHKKVHVVCVVCDSVSVRVCLSALFDYVIVFMLNVGI